MVQGSGFDAGRIYYDSFRYRYTDGSAMLNHFFIKLAFLPAWIELVPPENQEQVFADVESRLNDGAARDGAVILTIPFATFDCRRQ